MRLKTLFEHGASQVLSVHDNIGSELITSDDRFIFEIKPKVEKKSNTPLNILQEKMNR